MSRRNRDIRRTLPHEMDEPLDTSLPPNSISGGQPATPADAKAALEARDARIRAEERERCAKVAAGAFHAIPDDEKEATSALYYDGMEVMGFRIAAAIRAMGDE